MNCASLMMNVRCMNIVGKKMEQEDQKYLRYVIDDPQFYIKTSRINIQCNLKVKKATYYQTNATRVCTVQLSSVCRSIQLVTIIERKLRNIPPESLCPVWKMSLKFLSRSSIWSGSNPRRIKESSIRST